MLNWVRLSIAVCMGCVVAVGNVPALLHVSAHAPSLSHIASSPESTCHSCSCGHHHAQDPEGDSEQNQEHDHQNCRVCQSIFTFFVPAEYESEVVSKPFHYELLPIVAQCLISGADLSLPESRGPPASLLS